MTIQELARAAGLSAGLISEIERDRVGPSVASLWKIAEGLGVPINYFFRDQTETQCVVRRDRRKKIQIPESKLTYELLCPNLKGKIEFLLVEIEPGECDASEKISHQGEECGLVLQGKLKVKWGDKEFILEEGDSIYFDSTVPHRYQNIGDTKAVSVWAMTPPSF